MIRRCLIIDNEDQSDEIEKLIRDAKAKGVELHCEQFHVGNTEYDEMLTKGRIDIDKVVYEYRKKHQGTTFHLVAVDWDFEDDEVNGIELIRKLEPHNILTHSPKIVYSGLLDEIIKDIIKKGNHVRSGVIVYKDFDKKVRRIKSLISNDVRGYHERGKRDIQIIKYFTEQNESLDLIIQEILNSFPDLKFKQKFVREEFNGQKYSEIASFLEGNHQIRNKFKKEITEQVIAYLTEKI